MYHHLSVSSTCVNRQADCNILILPLAVCPWSLSFIRIACRLHVLMADIEVARVPRDRIFCVQFSWKSRAWEVHVDLLIWECRPPEDCKENQSTHRAWTKSCGFTIRVALLTELSLKLSHVESLSKRLGSWDSAMPIMPQLKTSFLRRYPEYELNLGCQSQMPCPIRSHPSWDQDRWNRWPWIEHSTVALRCMVWTVWTGTLKLVSWNALLKTALRFHQLHDTSGLWTSTSTIFDFPCEWMEKHCFSWTNPYMQDTVCAYCLISESRNNNGTGTLASTVDDIIIFFLAIFHDCWGQCTWQFVHALHVYTAIFFDKKTV